MDENRKFDSLTKISTEFLPDGSRIYTLEFPDGGTKSFIISRDEEREFLKSMYNKKYMDGETFNADEYEEKREEYILSIDDLK